MIAISSHMIQAGGGWGHMGSWAWGMALLGLLFTLLVVGLVVWLVVYSTGGRRDTATTTKGPLDVLEERYARGEIDREEYLEKRSDLEP